MRGFSLCRLSLCTGHAELGAAHTGCCFGRGAPGDRSGSFRTNLRPGAAPCHGAWSHGAQRSSVGRNVVAAWPRPGFGRLLFSEVIWALAALEQDLSLSSPLCDQLSPCWQLVSHRVRPESHFGAGLGSLCRCRSCSRRSRSRAVATRSAFCSYW